MRAASILVLAACHREQVTPPAPTKRGPEPEVKTCADSREVDRLIAEAAERRHAAFATRLADRGLTHVSLTPLPIPPSAKTIATGCTMTMQCCSHDRLDPRSLRCADGGTDPPFYKNAKGELFVVRDLPSINPRAVAACGTAPAPPCHAGCGCPTQLISTQVEVPPGLTYAGALTLQYDVEGVAITYERAAPSAGCKAVP